MYTVLAMAEYYLNLLLLIQSGHSQKALLISTIASRSRYTMQTGGLSIGIVGNNAWAFLRIFIDS